jgi:hypothetical protein
MTNLTQDNIKPVWAPIYDASSHTDRELYMYTRARNQVYAGVEHQTGNQIWDQLRRHISDRLYSE